MGIDIYLNGYKAYEKRLNELGYQQEFDRAVKVRDSLPKGSKAHEDAQKAVHIAADKMWNGEVGYLRSSYNSSGLFRVLEEIFGFDIGAYFFPKDWDRDQHVNGTEFVRLVTDLQRAAALALGRGNMALPWTNEFTEVTGKRASDANAAHVSAEEFGDSVMRLLSQSGLYDIEPKPRANAPTLCADHVWYLTKGLGELRAFGELAARLNQEGKRTYAHISY